MKDKMLVNLFENRLAFPLKNYPKKPTGIAGGFELDGSFTIDQMVFDDDGKPCWDNPHHIAMVKFSKLVAFAANPYIPYKKTLYSKYVAVDPLSYNLVIDPLDPPEQFKSDTWTETDALSYA